MTPTAPNFLDSSLLIGLVNGKNKNFIIAEGAVPSQSLRVFRNGMLATITDDYTYDGYNVIFNRAPTVSDTVQTFYRNSSTFFYVASSFANEETPTGARNGLNPTYVLSNTPNPVTSLELYWNGQLLTPGLDFSLFNKTITLLTSSFPNDPDDELIAYYRLTGITPGMPAFQDAEILPAGDGMRTDFLLAYPPLNNVVKLYKNGLLLSPERNYTSAGQTIIFNNSPLPADKIIAYYQYISLVPLNRFQSNLKSNLTPYVQRYLDDPLGKIWPESTVQQLIKQAESEISQDVNTTWIKFPISLKAGIGLYELPSNIKSITRITYLGHKIELITQRQMSTISPIYRTQASRPRYATMQFEDNSLRLFPVPAVHVPARSDQSTVYHDTHLQNEFVVSAYIAPTEDTEFFQLPDWICRRTIKLFVMWRAYLMEGPGQSITTAQYYKARYDQQVQKNKEYVAKVHAAKDRTSGVGIGSRPWTPARPSLPTTFGEIWDQ